MSNVEHLLLFINHLFFFFIFGEMFRSSAPFSVVVFSGYISQGTGLSVVGLLGHMVVLFLVF